MSLLSRAALCAVTTAVFGSSTVLYAQWYPVKPIRVVVPFPPGSGAIELISRLVGSKLSESLGQPLLIENRPGANGIIGSELAARAAPDGYTLLFTLSSTAVIGAVTSKNLPFDPVKSFTPISLATTITTTLAVHPSIPVNSAKELIEYAKRNPGKLNYGSTGIGSLIHLTGEQIKQIAGEGSAQAINDLLAGRIEIYFPGVSNLRSLPPGKLKVLAIMQSTRYPGLPDVPALVEEIPGFQVLAPWNAFFGPAGLQNLAVRRLNAEIVKAVKEPDVRAKLDGAGIQPVGSTPEQLASVLKGDIERAGQLVTSLGIRPE